MGSNEQCKKILKWYMWALSTVIVSLEKVELGLVIAVFKLGNKTN